MYSNNRIITSPSKKPWVQKETQHNINEPEVQDFVKHKFTRGYTGTVIAKYPLTKGLYRQTKKNYLDIHLTQGNKIEYETPAENWEVLEKYKENE